jgi:hypothetical protein
MRGRYKILGLSMLIGVAGLVVGVGYMIAMPGESHERVLPPLTAAESDASRRLREDVVALAQTLGERRVAHGRSLAAAADYLFERLASLAHASGSDVAPRRERLGAHAHYAENLVLHLPGEQQAAGLVLVGAHYDSARGTPGANDNGSGVAALLELARRFAGEPLAYPLRFVLFANEEQPFFEGPGMGSEAHAATLHASGESVRAMLSLETLGYYSDRPGTQAYPWPLSLAYPDTGNFVAFVGNLASARVVRQVVGSFRAHARFPSEAAALPESMPGVGWSDHASFWRYGYPALMVTDTAPFRYPHYHTAQDLPEHVDFERVARVVAGLELVLRELVSQPQNKVSR